MAIEDLFADEMARQQDRRLIQTITTGTVKDVTDNTCTVERENDATLYDVRLQSIEDQVNSFIRIKPVVGSVVLCGIIENIESEACVLQCSEIEEYWIKISGNEYRITSNGHLMANGGDNLKDALILIIDACLKIIILQGRNPDLVKLMQAKTKVLNIFQ